MTDWPVKTLDALCDEGVVLLGRGNIISKKDIAANPGPYPIYSSARENEGKFGEYGAYMFNEEMITWSIDGGGRLFYRPKHKFSVTNVGGTLRVLKPDVLEIRYLHRALENLHSRNVFDWVFKAHPSVIRKTYDEIPVPPIDEQKRIVELLDAATTRITELTLCYEQARTEANNLFTSALINVLVPLDRWPVRRLGDLCLFVRGPFGGSLKKSVFVPSGHAVYEQQHAIYERFDQFRYFVSEDKFKEMERFAVSPGDILMSCSGTIGKTAIVPSRAPAGIINQALLKLSCLEMLNNQYLRVWMRSIYFQEAVLGSAGGAALQNVASVAILKNIPISLPPLEEQKQIVARLDLMMAKTSEMVAAYDAKLAAAKDLRQSMLEAAFGGSL
jgi:restriction endonuclease S subunit